LAFFEINDWKSRISNEAKLFPSPKVLQNSHHYKMHTTNQWLKYQQQQNHDEEIEEYLNRYNTNDSLLCSTILGNISMKI